MRVVQFAVIIVIVCTFVGVGLVSMWRGRKKGVRRTEAEEIAHNAAIDQLLMDFLRCSEYHKALWR